MEAKIAVLETEMKMVKESLKSIFKSLNEIQEGVSANRTELRNSRIERERRKALEESEIQRRQRRFRYILGTGAAIGTVLAWLADHWHKMLK